MFNAQLIGNWHNWLIVGSMALIGTVAYAVVRGYAE